ncbi:MAG: hypothetical protein JO250_21550 [Armatimonadetes bacterium]|nr:hypothetical protein [Armatimonadota bacterium]
MSDSRLDEVLFRADGTAGVVAVETGEREATLFVRAGDGGTRMEMQPCAAR